MTETLKITPAMRRAKALLHKACPDRTLQTLSVNDSELFRYVAPTPMPLLKKWIADSPEFWPWLLTPVETDSDALRAKELAYSHLVEVLELKMRREDGSVDYEALKAKQKAVELLLARDKPLVQVANNTLHANTQTLPPGSVPRGLRGRNADMIEGRIRTLQSAVPDERVSAVDVVPEEDEL
jgi:hypothetical protein